MPISFVKKTKNAPKEEVEEQETEQVTEQVQEEVKPKAKVKTPEDIITENDTETNIKESGLAHTIVTKEHKGKLVEEVTNETEVHSQSSAIKAHELARVSVTLGTKINMGDYNSINMSVTLTLPCKVGEEDEVFGYASGWCEERVAELATKAQSEATGDDEA